MIKPYYDRYGYFIKIGPLTNGEHLNHNFFSSSIVQGRFEVAIEVPPPRSVAQRMSILNVHMKHMFKSGRLLVRDAPVNSVAARLFNRSKMNLMAYNELLRYIAEQCDTMSGASLAAVARAAASRALERAVGEFTDYIDTAHDDQPKRSMISDCVVTQDDFDQAVHDVIESSRDGGNIETS